MTEETSRPIPTADEINDALNRTGFLLEYRVAQSLRKRPHSYATISEAYTDPETGKSREIDVSGHFERTVRRVPINIGIMADLVIECKNSSAPFVVIGDRGHDYAWVDPSVYLTFDPLSLKFPRSKWSAVEHQLKLEHLPGSPIVDDFTGYQLLRVNRQNGTWRADNSGVYDSILYPLAKASFHQIDKRYEEEAEETGDDEKEWSYPYLYYTFPIIVTSGEVFTVDVTDGEPKISQARWARLKRTFKSKELDGELRADLVSFDHWEEYLDSRVTRTIDSAENVLARNMHLFDPEWLLANLGEPQDKEYFNEWLDTYRERRKPDTNP